MGHPVSITTRKLPNGDAVVIDARHRFKQLPPCRECGQPGTTIVLPRVDHRRRKPWPQPYWLCRTHEETSQ